MSSREILLSNLSNKVNKIQIGEGKLFDIEGLGLDKCSIGIKATGYEEKKKIDQCLWLVEKKMGLVELPFKEANKYYHHLYSKKGSYHLFVKPQHSGNMPYVKCVINPTKQSDEQLRLFVEMLSALFDLEYTALFPRMYFIRCEVFCDFITELDGHLFYASNVRKVGNCESTLYLGSNPNEIKVYNKFKELLSKQGVDIGHTLTRIECEMGGKALPLNALHQAKNPLAKVHVFKKEMVRNILSQSYMPKGIKWTSSCGFHESVRKLKPYGRKQLLDQLQQARADWWNPSQIWNDQWPHILHEKYKILFPKKCDAMQLTCS